MLRSLSLKKKLVLLCVLIASFGVVISYFSFKGLEDVENSNRRIIEGVVPNQEHINSMALSYREIRIQLRTLGIAGISQKDADAAIAATKQSILDYEKAHQAYEANEFLPGEKELFNDLNKNWLHFKSIGEKALGLYGTGKPEDREAMLKIFLVDCPDAAEKYIASLNILLNFHKTNVKNFTTESKIISNDTHRLIIIISVVGIILSLTLGFLFASSLAKSINNIVKSLDDSTNEVASAAAQIAATSDQLSQATAEQAASLQETSSSVEEINSMINANTENAKQSSLSSAQSLSNAEKGKEVVAQVIKAIDQINKGNNGIMHQIDESNKEIEEIVKLIGEIGTKTKVINDIVFQTKLLSFNASVEAARAGENGKGFAVVAEEVGNLAAMSGAAAVDISRMLDSSIQRVTTIVNNSKGKINVLMTEGKQNVEAGTKIAQECGSVLNEIVTSVAGVSSAIAEISSASQEQAQGVQEITKAIAQLDQVTQENSSSSAESANSAAQLSKQASNLKLLVMDLISAVEGENLTSKDANVNDKANDKTPIVQKSTSRVDMKQEYFPKANDARFSDV